jgi:probable rRNA maturation factor
MSTNTTLRIQLQYASPSIESSILATASAALIKKWVRSCTQSAGTLTLRFVNVAEGKKLNGAFRNKDYATNVLTFPYEHKRNFIEADIVFCLPVIQKEARAQGKQLKAHLAHLIVHGCLHAQGYDHEVIKDAVKMELLETAMLQKLGFTNPYLAH